MSREGSRRELGRDMTVSERPREKRWRVMCVMVGESNCCTKLMDILTGITNCIKQLCMYSMVMIIHEHALLYIVYITALLHPS